MPPPTSRRAKPKRRGRKERARAHRMKAIDREVAAMCRDALLTFGEHITPEEAREWLLKFNLDDYVTSFDEPLYTDEDLELWGAISSIASTAIHLFSSPALLFPVCLSIVRLLARFAVPAGGLSSHSESSAPRSRPSPPVAARSATIPVASRSSPQAAELPPTLRNVDLP
ncbi:hypothetical protein C8J57DRAFT_1677691 [Mycena rebaudengoi]|nr:hypothetical protein C8J57DRAFT_1677691 [Mycena rebaudengoi]